MSPPRGICSGPTGEKILLTSSAQQQEVGALLSGQPPLAPSTLPGPFLVLSVCKSPALLASFIQIFRELDKTDPDLSISLMVETEVFLCREINMWADSWGREGYMGKTWDL